MLKNAQWQRLTLGVAITALLRFNAIAAPSTSNEMTFTYDPPTPLENAIGMGSAIVYADGDIVAGTADKFASFVKANKIPAGTTVTMNSAGGSVAEALLLGQEIRNDGFGTEVEGTATAKRHAAGQCFSACTLAFLGGANRYVAEGALFGVHQLSTAAKMSPNEALQLGQQSIGAIVAYATSMGAKPSFVYELTQASPSQINILTQNQLQALNVVTAAYATTWEIKTVANSFYLLATTRSSLGLNKLSLVCQNKQPYLLFMVNMDQKNMTEALDYDHDYGLEFDNVHIDLLPEEIAEGAAKSGDYVSTTIKLTPRILERLRSTNALIFEMMPPSHVMFHGFTTDFASGRDKFFSFLKTC